jgi:hypothetical protein
VPSRRARQHFRVVCSLCRLARGSYWRKADLCCRFSAEVYGSGSGDGNGKTTVVFVCLHGSAKSQMAAAHFNRIASERGLPFTAVSRGIEVDTLIPTRIRDGLNLDGLAPTDDVPIDGG